MGFRGVSGFILYLLREGAGNNKACPIKDRLYLRKCLLNNYRKCNVSGITTMTFIYEKIFILAPCPKPIGKGPLF